ncbi:MAG: hypothetical protein OEL89_00135 [Candidatus Peregrinibacteria bacterium]|nr:hypothetical protein [Candidatus Peregrinibacteria bacterium]
MRTIIFNGQLDEYWTIIVKQFNANHDDILVYIASSRKTYITRERYTWEDSSNYWRMHGLFRDRQK